MKKSNNQHNQDMVKYLQSLIENIQKNKLCSNWDHSQKNEPCQADVPWIHPYGEPCQVDPPWIHPPYGEPCHCDCDSIGNEGPIYVNIENIGPWGFIVTFSNQDYEPVDTAFSFSVTGGRSLNPFNLDIDTVSGLVRKDATIVSGTKQKDGTGNYNFKPSKLSIGRYQVLFDPAFAAVFNEPPPQIEAVGLPESVPPCVSTSPQAISVNGIVRPNGTVYPGTSTKGPGFSVNTEFAADGLYRINLDRKAVSLDPIQIRTLEIYTLQASSNNSCYGAVTKEAVKLVSTDQDGFYYQTYATSGGIEKPAKLQKNGVRFLVSYYPET